MQADEAGKEAEVVVECLVEHLGLPAETCVPCSPHLWPLGILMSLPLLAPQADFSWTPHVTRHLCCVDRA